MPQLKVLAFEQKFHLNPETGKHDKPVDWVLLSNINATAQTWHRVADLKPDGKKFDGATQSGRKTDMENMFRARWAVIEPKYDNWKKGHELPRDGTPIASWPFLSADEMKAFQAAGIHTIEEIAGMNDAAMGRVAVPAIRDKREAARKFLENADKNQLIAKVDDMESTIRDLKAKLETRNEKPESPQEVIAAAQMTQAKMKEESEHYKLYSGKDAIEPVVDAAQPKRRGRPPKAAVVATG